MTPPHTPTPPAPPRERLGVAEALAAVLAAADGAGDTNGARRPRVERVALADALGRVLARDVTAPAHVPPWPNAAMDGVAVRAADVLGAAPERPAALRVAGAAYAGHAASGTVEPGTAMRIATGAPVPAGADAVVRVEDTRPDPADPARVLVVHDRDARGDAPGLGPARRNVRPAGEDVRAGDVAATAGTRVTPGVAGLLAAVGAAAVDVAARPRVGILATGDELVPLARADEARAGRAIVSSSSYALAALVREAGGEPVDLGIAADTPEALGHALAGAREAACDLVLTTGGVSVGERDHVRPAMRAAGGALHFWRVRMRPGAPIAFGTLPFGTPPSGTLPSGTGREPGAAAGGPVPWLGLPGNPVSTVVAFALFARPLIAALAGDVRPFPVCLTAELDWPLRTAAPLTHLFRATLAAGDDGGLRARLTGQQGSGIQTSVARADGYVIVPEGVRALEPGARVWVLPVGVGGPAAHALPPRLFDALPGAPA